MKRIVPFLFVGLILALWSSVSAISSTKHAERGCFEDRPADLVLEAWSKQTNSPPPVQITNIATRGAVWATNSGAPFIAFSTSITPSPSEQFRFEQTNRKVVFSEANDILTNTVNLLVSSGQFCSVRGHVWGVKGDDNWLGLTCLNCMKRAMVSGMGPRRVIELCE